MPQRSSRLMRWHGRAHRHPHAGFGPVFRWPEATDTWRLLMSCTYTLGGSIAFHRDFAPLPYCAARATAWGTQHKIL
ncbi:hypothetical protein PENSPDRAFT_656879, partial [Peniophora sp. CONT]